MNRPLPKLRDHARSMSYIVTLSAASGLALAQAPGGTTAENVSSMRLEEVVVTAQKRVQNLQEVPVAVSALSGEALAARGITEASGLMGSMPNLQVNTAYGTVQPNFSLRGVSVANEFSASTASPVGLYVDEVYQSFRASHGQQLYDLERVEVLRGPQGTLYGRNTTGGAISFVTNKPQLAGTQGEFTVGYGNYQTKTAKGAFETTLIPDVLGIRIAGTLAKGDGWMYNPTQRRDIGTTDSNGARITVRWQPADAFDITLKGYTATDNPVASATYSQGQLSGQRDVLGYSRFDPQPQFGGRLLGEDEVASDTTGDYYSRSRGVALNINYELSNALSFTSITGYDTGKYLVAPYDCDGSPSDLCSLRYGSDSKNFNQDLRITYKQSGINIIGGLYFGQDTIDTHNEIDLFGALRPLLLGLGVPGAFNNAAVATPDSTGIIPAFAVNPSLTPASPGFCAPIVINPNGFLDARSLLAFQADVAATNSGGNGFGGAASAACRAAGAPPIGPILGDQYFTIKRPSTAIYGDVSYDFNAALTGSLGLRYTRDEVKYEDGRTTLFDLSGRNIAVSTIPYSRPYNASLAAVNQTEKANRLTGRANLSYRFTDDIMAYVNFSRGYRSGSFNGLAYQGTNQVYYIEPETVNAYEVGVKSRLFDARLQLNAAAFFYDYANHQVTQVVGTSTFTRSADGRLSGGEVEVVFQALDNLRFDASLGLLSSEYRGNKIDLTNPSSPTRNVNGNPFPNAPETTFNGGFDWDLIQLNEGKVTLRGDGSYMGKFYFDPYKDYGQQPCNQPAPGFNFRQAGAAIACGNPSYWLFNARLSYDTSNYSVSVWGKNLADKTYYTWGLNIDTFGLDLLNRGMPRTYGVELTARF